MIHWLEITNIRRIPKDKRCGKVKPQDLFNFIILVARKRTL